MIAVSVTVMTCCTAEDPFEEYNDDYNGWQNNASMTGGNSATTGELATFDIALDTERAEETENVKEYFPDEEDAL